MRILVTLPLSDADRQHVRAKAGRGTLRFVEAASVPEDDLGWADVVLGNLKPPEVLLRHPNIRWLHSPNVGLDAYAAVAAARPELAVTNVPGIADHVVSEHALALLLALTRSVPSMVRAQDRRRYDRDAFQGSRSVTLAGAHAHVLGYGSIARCLVAKLHGLSMRVTVYRRRAAGESPHVDRFLALSDLPGTVAGADVLINLLPDAPGTRGLVDAEVLGAMKPAAMFISVGRGVTVDEAALAEVLADGRLRGAALDVFTIEPLPASSPLWSLPNVLLSPHVAGRFEREMALHIDRFFEMLASAGWRRTRGAP